MPRDAALARGWQGDLGPRVPAGVGREQDPPPGVLSPILGTPPGSWLRPSASHRAERGAPGPTAASCPAPRGCQNNAERPWEGSSSAARGVKRARRGGGVLKLTAPGPLGPPWALGGGAGGQILPSPADGSACGGSWAGRGGRGLSALKVTVKGQRSPHLFSDGRTDSEGGRAPLASPAAPRRWPDPAPPPGPAPGATAPRVPGFGVRALLPHPHPTPC